MLRQRSESLVQVGITGQDRAAFAGEYGLPEGKRNDNSIGKCSGRPALPESAQALGGVRDIPDTEFVGYPSERCLVGGNPIDVDGEHGPRIRGAGANN